MLLGPLFHVEMVTVARRRRYFLLRVVYGALALFFLWTAFTSMRFFARGSDGMISIQQGAELAKDFFFAFSWLQILAVLAVGPAMAVGTIATERERRTIEYLFTTDLSNAEIVLSKLGARLCLLGQLLLVGLPIFFLFRLLGGIPAQLLLVNFLFAGSAALLIASISTCVSVWSERARDATVRVYLLLAVLLFLPLILHATTFGGMRPFGGWAWQTLVRPVLDFCLDVNPIWTLGNAIGNQNAIGAGLDMTLIWEVVGKQTLVSIATIALAVFAVRRVHLKETTKAAAIERKKRKWRLPRYQRPLGSNAILWKEMFAATAATKLGFVGRISMALILITICGFTSYVFIEVIGQTGWNRRNDFFEYLYGMTGFIGTGILLLLGARAAGLFSSEKERDCWLSLLATPLTEQEIVRGKMFGNLYSMRWQFSVLLAHWVLGIFIAPDWLIASNFLLVVIFMFLMFMLLAAYVTNVGLCFSLQSKTTLRAIGATLGTLIFTGGGYMFCCCLMLEASGSGGDEAMILFLSPCVPFLLMFPIMAFVDATNQDSFYTIVEAEMYSAFVVGMFLYVIAGAALYIYMTANFNRLAGRTEEAPTA